MKNESEAVSIQCEKFAKKTMPAGSQSPKVTQTECVVMRGMAVSARRRRFVFVAGGRTNRMSAVDQVQALDAIGAGHEHEQVHDLEADHRTVGDGSAPRAG